MLTISLGKQAHQLAGDVAVSAMQLVPEDVKTPTGKRVYLNALAVYTVDSYLKWQAYEPDMSLADSCHPIFCSRWDVADLVIPGIGKLECRPVWFGDTVVTIPNEVTEDRIGYVLVQFGEVLDSAKLLGFVPNVDSYKLPVQVELSELNSLDALIDHLYRLEVGNIFLQGNDPIAVQVREVMETNNISEIIAQLERVYEKTPKIKWRYAGADILAGSTISSAASREFEEGNEKIDFQKLAKNLLDKLAELWQCDI